MTRNEILIALADGKALEVLKDGTWVDVEKPTMSFVGVVQWADKHTVNGEQFRIKRTAREWWVNVYGGGHWIHAYPSKEDADLSASPDRLERVHVREVLE